MSSIHEAVGTKPSQSRGDAFHRFFAFELRCGADKSFNVLPLGLY